MSDNVFVQRAAGLGSPQTLAVTAAATAAASLLGDPPWETTIYAFAVRWPSPNLGSPEVVFLGQIVAWLVPVVLAALALFLERRAHQAPGWIATTAWSVVLLAGLHVAFTALNATRRLGVAYVRRCSWT